MNARIVFLEIAQEFGWGKCATKDSLHGCLDCDESVPSHLRTLMSKTNWSNGHQIDLYRPGLRVYGHDRKHHKATRITAYFPDNAHHIIRMVNPNSNKNFGYALSGWTPSGPGWGPSSMPAGPRANSENDFDLRDPESISKLRKWIKTYSKPPLTTWGRFLKFIGWSK